MDPRPDPGGPGGVDEHGIGDGNAVERRPAPADGATSTGSVGTESPTSSPVGDESKVSPAPAGGFVTAHPPTSLFHSAADAEFPLPACHVTAPPAAAAEPSTRGGAPGLRLIDGGRVDTLERDDYGGFVMELLRSHTIPRTFGGGR